MKNQIKEHERKNETRIHKRLVYAYNVRSPFD